MSRHVAVWLDHREARIFQFEAGAAHEFTVAAPPHNDHHKHTRGEEGLKEHPEDIRRFYRGLVTALHGAEQLLVLGPGSAHLEFIKFLQRIPSADGADGRRHREGGSSERRAAGGVREDLLQGIRPDGVAELRGLLLNAAGRGTLLCTMPITYDDILAAHGRIAPYLSPTPLRNYPELDDLVGHGVQVWVKHENHQPTQSFKIRNGLSAVTALDAAARERGVIGASTGNHGLGSPTPAGCSAFASRSACPRTTIRTRTPPYARSARSSWNSARPTTRARPTARASARSAG